MNFWRNALRTWSQQTATQLATFSVLIGAFTAISVSLLVQQNLEMILTRWGSQVKVNVYLEDKVPALSEAAIQKVLDDSKLFEKTVLISKDEAYVRFRDRLGAFVPSLSQDSSLENPLPKSFESILSKDAGFQDSFSAIKSLAEHLGAMAGVEEVSFGQGWVENYASAINVFSYTSWALILVLAGGSLLVIGNAIKSSVIQRQDEIEILELFGATRWSIQRPFVLEGLIVGFVATVIALLLSFGIFKWQSEVIVEGLNFWSLKSSMQFLDGFKVLFILLFGSLSGALGSFVCVHKVSTGWAAAERT